MSRIALVLAGGDPPPPDLLSHLPPPVITIAADSGIRHARAVGLRVDTLVGDMDSADEDSQLWAVEQGATLDVHPADKDQTDLELALDRVVRAMAEFEVDELVVLGLSGGRLDHWLANLLTLAGPRTASVSVTAYADRSRITVVRGRRVLTGRPGELVSLIPVGGPVHGITTIGLEYPLRSETLDAGTSRGVSNVFAGPTTATAAGAATGPADEDAVISAEVAVTSGTLLAIQPEFLATVDPAGDGAPDPDDPPSPTR